MSRNPVLLLAATLCLVLVAPLPAQRITGQITGTVQDETGAVLPGVTVSLSGANIVGTQTAITNANGLYRFIALPPGVYDLSFSLEGFSTQKRQDRVSVGATTVEDVTLQLGDVAEEITVTAEAPVIDVASSEVGVNYDRSWVENAPMQRQSFNDLVASAPGSLRGGDQSRRTMVYGSSYDENSFQLDGADVNDNFFNEQLAQPNIDAIEEIEVLSLGAPAEYGNLTGAVYNIVTRQGTNEFHGDVNFFSQSDGLTSRNTNAAEDDGHPFDRVDYTDYSLQLGGPIATDRVWFFLSYQHQEDAVLETGVNPALGPFAISDDKFDRYFAKINLQINPRHKLIATFHQDDAVESGGFDPDEAPSTAFSRQRITPTPGVGYTGVLSSNTLLEVRFTGFYGDVFLGPADPNAPLQQARIFNLENGFISGGHYYFYDLDPERTTLNTTVSHLADDFLGGDHDFRFGVQYNESEAGGLYGYNDFIYDYGGGNPLGYGYTRVPFSYAGNTEALGVFVDDDFRVNDRLTLNLGVRWDTNDAFSKAQDELDRNFQPTGVRFPRADYYTWEYVSPRLGFNLQLTDDGRTVLKGHVGRYHRAIATGEFANVIGPSIKPIFAGFYDLPSATFQELFQITDNANLSVDPNYRSPRTDQFFLTLEHQIGRNLGFNVNLVRKRGRDFAAWQDVGGLYEDVIYVDDEEPGATGDSIPVFRLLTDPSDLSFVITNRDEMDYDVDAVSVGVVKRMADNWYLNSSLIWLEAEGRTPDSAGGTSVLQRGGLQFRRFGRNPNDFVNTGGALRGDIPWQFKTQFIYQFPLDFMVGANLSWRSGANRVRRVRLDRDVTNLSTTILAPERGAFGRLPSQALLDVRLQKDFTLRGGLRLGLIADFLNVLNEDAHEETRGSIAGSSNFDLPEQFVLPRRVMLGAKLRF